MTWCITSRFSLCSRLIRRIQVPVCAVVAREAEVRQSALPCNFVLGSDSKFSAVDTEQYYGAAGDGPDVKGGYEQHLGEYLPV